jgi:hypothetical protein
MCACDKRTIYGIQLVMKIVGAVEVKFRTFLSSAQPDKQVFNTAHP